jgi:hypothetical protein
MRGHAASDDAPSQAAVSRKSPAEQVPGQTLAVLGQSWIRAASTAFSHWSSSFVRLLTAHK